MLEKAYVFETPRFCGHDSEVPHLARSRLYPRARLAVFVFVSMSFSLRASSSVPSAAKVSFSPEAPKSKGLDLPMVVV